MKRFVFLFVAALCGLAALSATADTAQAQVYVADRDIYVGDRVTVFDGARWVPARVIALGVDEVLIEYLDAYGGTEWVDLARVSLRGTTVGVVYQPAIQVYWHNTWWPGVLLERRGNRYRVHYHGRVEWVGPERWHHHSVKHRHAYQRGHRARYDHFRPATHHRRDWRDRDRNRDRDRGRDRHRERDRERRRDRR